MTSGIQIIMWRKGSEFSKSKDLYIGIALASVLFIVPFAVFLFIYYYRRELNKKNMRATWGILY